MLGKFADLPQEAEDEIRGLDQARRRIAELEREIKRLKSVSLAPQIDLGVSERAVRLAVERERTEWRRKLEQGRAHFRKMIGATASAVQAFEKVKVLLDEAESEWASPPAVVEARAASLNNWHDHVSKPANHSAASAEALDGSFKLASGERRLLTALAQYPEGRSKVQVAVLTGYAAAGGGFNNYLGALRSRGLVQGDGDRLTITDAGIQTLGSWEPLPTSGAPRAVWATASSGDPCAPCPDGRR